MTKTLLSFGHGYCAQALGRLLLPQGWRIVGTTRDARKAGDLLAAGIEPFVWGVDDIAPKLAEATHILVSAAPDANGDPVLRACAKAIAANAPYRWTGYLSTTGVYGDHGGAWVDEDTAPRPTTERGRRRVLAERAWQDLAEKQSLNLHIFRLAGIYGPGRGPFAKVRDGTARRIVKPGQVFSRIHVDDIAQALAASIVRPDPGAIYNLCDDDPAPPENVIAHAAELLGLPVPPAEDWKSADLTPMARSFYGENKRVRNDRMKTELGVVLRYPDFRSGLRSLLDLEGQRSL